MASSTQEADEQRDVGHRHCTVAGGQGGMDDLQVELWFSRSPAAVAPRRTTPATVTAIAAAPPISSIHAIPRDRNPVGQIQLRKV